MQFNSGELVLESQITDPSLNTLLATSPEFSFFSAVRLVQSRFPHAARVGFQGPPEKEALRFKPSLELSFPSADIEDATEKSKSSEKREACKNRRFHILFIL